MPRTEPLLTSADVALQLRVSPRTVARLVATHVLPTYRLGRALRFLQADIDAWIASTRVEAVAVAPVVVQEVVYDDKPRIRPELVSYRGKTVKQRRAS
jgi:excisionase family DNA binding protein